MLTWSWLAVAFALVLALVAGMGYLFDAAGQLLPPEWRSVILGLVLGFLLGLRVGDWCSRRSRAKAVSAPQSDA